MVKPDRYKKMAKQLRNISEILDRNKPTTALGIRNNDLSCCGIHAQKRHTAVMINN
jgi:hypothetical protein